MHICCGVFCLCEYISKLTCNRRSAQVLVLTNTRAAVDCG